MSGPLSIPPVSYHSVISAAQTDVVGRQEYDRNGMDRMGFNRVGLNIGARNALGYDYLAIDPNGFSIREYKNERDEDGYNEGGFNADGHRVRRFFIWLWVLGISGLLCIKSAE